MTPPTQTAPIVIAGGSGFIGVSLGLHLATLGIPVVMLSRNAPKAAGAWRHVPWDARTLGPWTSALDGAAAVVNLAGRSVDCVKTPDHCDEILRSRVESTLVLGRAMRVVAEPPPVWVQMSTTSIHGDPPQVVCDEDSPPGYGFAPFVGKAWEEAFHSAAMPGQRKVILRTSFILGRDRGAGSGALSRLRTVVRLGLGGAIASGTQGISWIHETDMNRLLERSMTDATMEGVFNAATPNPLPQRQFMRELRAAMRMPIGLPATAWMVHLGAKLFLRTDGDLAIYGRYVISRRLREAGFEFRFPQLRDALADLFAEPTAVTPYSPSPPKPS